MEKNREELLQYLTLDEPCSLLCESWSFKFLLFYFFAFWI